MAAAQVAGCAPELPPPREVDLDRSVFESEWEVPVLLVPVKHVSEALKLIRKHEVSLRLKNVKVVRPAPDAEDGTQRRALLLDPKLGIPPTLPPELQTWFDEKEDARFQVSTERVRHGYDHLSISEVLERVLPEGVIAPSSFEAAGHVAHLNLTDEQMPWRRVIGQVVLDKNAGIRTVVTKVGNIDSKFRTFDMEVIAGEGLGTYPPPPLEVEVVENKARFRLDYRHVYWNSRLQLEHGKLADDIMRQAKEEGRSSPVVADMFAGVGPFAVPLGLQGARVLANDLNPESFRWLQHNVQLNKVARRVKCFNLDGREFIRTLLRHNRGEGGEGGEGEVNAGAGEGWEGVERFEHVIMNLPASAIEFLDVFRGAFDRERWPEERLPRVHCYGFSYTMEEDAAFFDATRRAAGVLGLSPPAAEEEKNKDAWRRILPGAEVRIVRDVAPKKVMVLLSFQLSPEIAFTRGVEEEEEEGDGEEPSAKRPRVE